MICPKCGKDNSENINWCSYCGAALEEFLYMDGSEGPDPAEAFPEEELPEEELPEEELPEEELPKEEFPEEELPEEDPEQEHVPEEPETAEDTAAAGEGSPLSDFSEEFQETEETEDVPSENVLVGSIEEITDSPEQEYASRKKKEESSDSRSVRRMRNFILFLSLLLIGIAVYMVMFLGMGRDLTDRFTGSGDRGKPGQIKAFTAEYFPGVSGGSPYFVFYAKADGVPALFLEDQRIGEMHDDGIGEDTTAGDGIYSLKTPAVSYSAKTVTYYAGFDAPSSDGIPVTYTG